jgi:hypothetical protein
VTWKPDYITTADVKAYLRVTDTVDDVQLQAWATASSRAVDRATNRQFGLAAAPVARVYRIPTFYDPTNGLFILPIDDLMTTTGMLVNGVAYASSGTTLLPDNAPADGRPWTRLGFTNWPVPQSPGGPISNIITAQWGWTTVPAQVPVACELQCARWNFRRDAPAGVAGSPDQGSEVRLLAKLDPDVAITLAGLVRPRRAA